MSRLGFLLLLLGLATGAQAQTQQTPHGLAPDAPTPAALGTDTYRLWPGAAPGAVENTLESTPTLTLYRPQFPRPDGASVVIAPGGAYIGLAARLEGVEPAAWFTARGITAFVLTYRVGPKARLPIPLADGARAIRFVRSHAHDFDLDPNRIGMMGFSAGGHLAATTAVDATPGQAQAQDPVERAGSRPDFLVLVYPWLEGTKPRPDGTSSYCDFAKLVGPACEPSAYARFAPLAHVSAQAPPTFIFHTTNDELVPVGGSARFYQALVDHGVPAEFHAFAEGRHGAGLGGASAVLQTWPALLDLWLRAKGLIEPAPVQPGQ
ncbi:alpha/beta hydrolase [Caulobacter sp. Root1472]|uniref:alpha/beta hydrolase n=1 Tax=Caulobacter sp. Root1472 TaxID=1736470 RepID=UPI0006F30696|nr:alpha/beta hydrolase [Caulobacter sp. Root1472]KQZ26400.1 alpha/beta hydrolase [Caulobacter sp. Root1472]